MTDGRAFGIPDVIEAELHARRGGTDEDRERVAAVRRVVDAHLDADPDRASAVEDLIESTYRAILRCGSPFDGYLEAPRVVHRLYAEHGASIRGIVDGFERESLALLRSAYAANGLGGLTFTIDDLRREGFTGPERRTIVDDDW